jgi:D-glycero-alpha-D-manno-heptose-7-phosphate kinase
MIISRTPFRISFVGGGTDFKKYYAKETGGVLSTTIDKYIYVTVKKQLNIVEYKYRVSWAKSEFVNEIDEIEHPIVREALRLLEIDYPVEITTFADVPSGTGLGSSSSFAVGLLHALFALKNHYVTKAELAEMAAHIEVDILKRNIGKQDHYAAAYGDINAFYFHKDESVSVEPVFYEPEIRREIENRLLMFYTNITRNASKILKSQVDDMENRFNTLTEMKNLIPAMREIFGNSNSINDFGRILHKGWMLKKSLTKEIANGEIDDYYEKALKAGAIGGKLLGAGGGGFLLFYAEQINHNKIREALKDLVEMKFRFDKSGTRITYYDELIF